MLLAETLPGVSPNGKKEFLAPNCQGQLNRQVVSLFSFVFLVMMKSLFLEPPGCLIFLCGVESFYTCNKRDSLPCECPVVTSPLPLSPIVQFPQVWGWSLRPVSEIEHFLLIFSYCQCGFQCITLGLFVGFTFLWMVLI